MADTRYLERRRQGFYAVVEVPPSLRAKLAGRSGKPKRRLVKTLETRNLAVAKARRWAVVAELRAIIETARTGGGTATLVDEALGWRDALDAAAAGADIAGAGEDPLDFVRDLLRDRAAELAARDRAAAVTLVGLATRTSTLLATNVERFLTEGGVKGPFAERTKGDHRRAIAELCGWLEREKLPPTVEAVTRQVAGRYMSEHLLVSGRAGKTVGKAVSALSAYWTWLRRRGHASEAERNVWAEQAPAKQKAADGEDRAERPFTDAEVSLMLARPFDRLTDDFLRIALLSGLRRAEVGSLTVGDVQDGVFVVQRGKTAAARRRVPVHPDLAGIVAERCAGKAATDHLFSDLPGRGSETALGERTDAFGKRFTRWRRTLGIQDGAGRRSAVNLHSARRWFVSKAVNAGQPPHMVSLVVGHTEGRKGMTLGRYWGGADDEALRTVVEAVRLP